ncbi:secreted RxLR effector protein 161-like [Prosopis cineraria]|uniref:secreted RxLR effector protein 161-like n=1 Tax=Prosopis cineraria TaxID=364024 RepID=UPI00240F8ABA|nr:secreted RxLR effector protein 161-like [Prosopis cineraria]
MLGSKPEETPIVVSRKKKKKTKKESEEEDYSDDEVEEEDKEKEETVDKERYQRLVGKLIYLYHTRPDIAFAVSVASQYMCDPRKKDLEAVYRILRYLKGTPGKGFLFKKHDQRSIEIYTDADWGGTYGDRRSTSGYSAFVWGNLVTWKRQKQRVLSRSSAQSEFRALAQGITEELWIRRVMEEIQVRVDPPIKLYCDNKAAISMALNPVQHEKSKHVEVG